MEKNIVLDMHHAIKTVFDKFDKDSNTIRSANSLLVLAKDLNDWSKLCINEAYDGRSDLHNKEDLEKED